MKLPILTLLLGLLFTASACGQTEGQYVSVRTVTDVFFQDTILNIVTSDTTFRDTIFNTGGGGAAGQATQTLDTIDFDFLATAANLPGGTILNPDFTTAVTIPWSTSPVKTSARYTLSGTDVSVAFTGWYRISGYLSTNPSTAQRYNGRVYLQTDKLSDEWTATGYSRAMSSQDQTTLYFEFYKQLTAGVPFRIVQICEGGDTGAANAVTLDNLASRLLVIPLTQNFVELASGPAGAAGLSAYDVWLSEGNTGTEAEFLISLQGEQGPAGPAGGPIGPAGPAGSPSDTAADGSYYRLFTTDDAGAYYNFTLSDGVAGLELFDSGSSNLYRMYPYQDYLLWEGDAFRFAGDFKANNFESTFATGVSFSNAEIGFTFNTSGMKFSDSRGSPRGLEYTADYSDSLKTNPRSIPDVGTVEKMIGVSAVPNSDYQGFTFSATVSPNNGGMYVVSSLSQNNISITLNPQNLTTGDRAIFLVTIGASQSVQLLSTTGLFRSITGSRSDFDILANTSVEIILTWSGQDWHVTSNVK